MKRLERLREVVDGKIEEARLGERRAEGWRLAAVEWEREVVGEPSPDGERPLRREIPFGLQISADCLYLEENPREKAAMDLMLDQICDDQSISQIADTLNQRGFRSRRGEPWTRTMVFNLLPRLVEVAPEIRFREPALAG